MDALKRIIQHDNKSGWSNTPGGLSRSQVVQDCVNGKIIPAKLYDQVGDALYNVRWPLPLKFNEIK